MRITIPVEIGLSELCTEVEESLNNNKEISCAAKFNLLCLLKYLNFKEETKEQSSEENPIDDLLDEEC